MQTILEQAKALAPEIISWRHQIHMQPEVGLDLPKTVALVTEELKKMGTQPQECGGGVVAVLGQRKAWQNPSAAGGHGRPAHG